MFWPGFAFSPILRLIPLICMTSILSFVWTPDRSRSFVLDLMVSLLPFVSKIHWFYIKSCWAPAPLIGYPILFPEALARGGVARELSLLKRTPKTQKTYWGLTHPCPEGRRISLIVLTTSLRTRNALAIVKHERPHGCGRQFARHWSCQTSSHSKLFVGVYTHGEPHGRPFQFVPIGADPLKMQTSSRALDWDRFH